MFSEHPIGCLKMGLEGCSEKSVKNCHYTTLHNFPEECKSLIFNAPILSVCCVVLCCNNQDVSKELKNSVGECMRNLVATFSSPYIFINLSDITNVLFLNIISLLVSKLCPLVYRTFKGIRLKLFWLCVKPVMHVPSPSYHHLQIVCCSLPPFVVRTDENKKEPGLECRLGGQELPSSMLEGRSVIHLRALVLFSQLLEHPSYTYFMESKTLIHY